MHKKTYLLPIAIFVIILLLTSLACSLPFSGGDDGDSSGGSSVEVDGDIDGDSDGGNEMEDNDGDSDGGNEMEENDANGDNEDSEGDSDNAPDSPFPLTDDADILLQDDTSVIYGTKLSIDETIEFYRTEFSDLGFTERDLLTAIVDDSFSFVFDGHSSGQAIVVQGTDFGDSTSVSIRFEDI